MRRKKNPGRSCRRDAGENVPLLALHPLKRTLASPHQHPGVIPGASEELRAFTGNANLRIGDSVASRVPVLSTIAANAPKRHSERSEELRAFTGNANLRIGDFRFSQKWLPQKPR